jgi:hypothetical protein
MDVSAKGLAAVALCTLASACASPELSSEVSQLRQQNQQLQQQVAAINQQLGLDKANGVAPAVHENEAMQIQNVRGQGGGKLCLSTAGIAAVSFPVYAVPCTGPNDPTAGSQRWAPAPAP